MSTHIDATPRTRSRTFRASVVIPAHNEARVIARCLDSLRTQAGNEIEVVVAANGCTDDTAALARAHRGLPNLQVVDLPEPSKARALNAGDRVVSALPELVDLLDSRDGTDVAKAIMTTDTFPKQRSG